MKPRLILIISLFILIFIQQASYSQGDVEDVILIGGEKNYPPFEYVDEDGEYRGFNVDLMRALAIELGIEIKLIPMDWVEAHVSLQNGEIDAIQGMNYNEARQKIYDFSDEYLVNSLACFVKKENSDIYSIDNLKGNKVAVQRSDFAGYVLADIGEIEVMFFSDLDGAFNKLLVGEVNAVVCNRLTGLYVLQSKRIADDIKIVGQEKNHTSYGMAFKKGNDKLAGKFNTGLTSLKRKGIYYQIYEKWFGKEIKPAWKDLTYTLYILLGVLMLVLISAIIVMRFNNRLKHEVKKRTNDLEKANKELKENQDIIRESNMFKEQVLNCLGNGLITFDKNGIITTVNKTCEDLIQIDNSNIKHKKYDSVGIEKYFDIDHIKDCIEKGVPYNLQEKSFLINQKEYVFSYTLWPLYDYNNNHIGAVLTFRDSTELKNLKKKLGERDKMQSLGRLISGISHEIRNPLTTIKTYIDILPIKYDNKEFREKIVHQVPAEITRLNGLLSDLIDYSKPKKMKKEYFDLEELVIYTTEFFSSEFCKRDIAIEYNINKTKRVYADKQQIKQILINIILNSLDSIKESGKIIFEIKQNIDQVIISIIDNGIGIPKEELKNIFDPFFTKKSDGTGLGLSICYQYANDNDAIISIDSELGKWTKADLVFTKTE